MLRLLIFVILANAGIQAKTNPVKRGYTWIPDQVGNDT